MGVLTGLGMVEILNKSPQPWPKNFIETGTGMGATCMKMRNVFDNVHTIENSPQLFQRFIQRYGQMQVVCHAGDTLEVLPKLMEQLVGRIVFFLDAHFCKGNIKDAAGGFNFPLWKELELLKERHEKTGLADIVIVDDVHTFGKDRGTQFGDWQNVDPASLENSLGGRDQFSHDSFIFQDSYVMFLSEQ